MKRRAGWYLLHALIAVTLLHPQKTWAQADSGRISGIVKDSLGAVVAHAKVTATRTDTGDTKDVTTENSGLYVFSTLRAGVYSVSVEAPGFGLNTRTGYELLDAGALTVNFELKPSAEEQITINTTTVDTVNTQTGEVSHVIDGDTVRDLALNGRNYIDLLGTLPGAVQASLGDAIAETTSRSTTGINLNGGRATANGLYIDGFINKDLGSNSTQFNNIGIDFIEHVKVQTSAYAAAYGLSGGPTINVVTRSGANSWHGAVFEHIRNSITDATNYFSRNAVTYAPIPAHLRYNNPGFALGGPLLKNKVFIFAGAEWKLLAQKTQPTTVTEPLQQELAGNFLENGVCGLGKTVPVYSGNGKWTAMPVNASCNISQYITPFGQAFSNEYQYAISQATSYAGVACTVTGCSNNGNTIYELSQPFRNHEFMTRLDWNISKRQNAYARWIADTFTTTVPIGDGDTPVTPYHSEVPANNLLLAYTATITPNAVNEISFGTLFSSTNQQPYGNAWMRSTYGYNYQPLFVNGSKIGAPDIELYGYADLQASDYVSHYHPSYFQVNDTFTLVAARHTFKFGAQLGHNRADVSGQASYLGSFNFQAQSNTNTTGSAVADALLGNFQSYTEYPNPTFSKFRMSQTAAFVDDVWRAAAKLSINYGLRFEHMTPWYATDNNLSDFYPSLYSPAQAVTVDQTGLLIAGSGNRLNGLRRVGDGLSAAYTAKLSASQASDVLSVPTIGKSGFYKSQYVFMPRVGFAYDLFGNGRTSLRGGAGLFYDTAQANTSYATDILPPYASSQVVLSGNAGDLSQNSGVQKPFGAMYTLDPNFQRTYTIQYNFGLQQQLMQGMFFQMNYVGSQGRHLLRHPDINGIDPSVEDCVVAAFTAAGATTPVSDWMRQYTGDTLPTSVTSTVTKTGLPVTFGLKGSTLCNTLPAVKNNGYGGYAGYDGIYQWRSDVDYNYNGLQVNLNRRVGQKGRFTVAYTFSKALTTGSADTNTDHIEIYSKHYNYGPATFDRRNVVALTYIIQTGPLRRANRVAQTALGAWTMSGTGRYQSGTYNTATGTDQLGVSSRAIYCGYPVYYGHGQMNWWYSKTPMSANISGAGQANFVAPSVYASTDTVHYASTAASPCQGNYTPGVGNSPIGNIIGPNFLNIDISLRKTFEVRERSRLTISFDVFNPVNHPNFAAPSTNVSGATTPGGAANAPIAGTYLGISTAGRPRNLSAGARYTF